MTMRGAEDMADDDYNYQCRAMRDEESSEDEGAV